MKIGFPVEDNEGLNSDISPNFRATPTIMVIDTETDAIEIIDTQGGICGRIPTTLDVLVYSDGLGRGMFKKLQNSGTKVFQTYSFTVEEALQEFKEGKLQEVLDAECGCGDEHHHEHHHGSDGGCGCGGHHHH